MILKLMTLFFPTVGSFAYELGKAVGKLIAWLLN
ncbi:hypothetical protein SAMN05421780_10521 [Flexibacter flexilis DSM 6793]|uniref:Uncharacterized protein n=1 Tax=Flexibacter flexilis DSM 6793 TaxID=927664 RepID=A0A1I1ISU4_9BACT|nr:hypothetical protein SAMN05421780_10521 [Flexibacter flexilis DSM 6793]